MTPTSGLEQPEKKKKIEPALQFREQFGDRRVGVGQRS